MKKRILSILTALCLCLTLLPTAALAEGGTDGGTSSDTHTNHCVCGLMHNSVGDHDTDQSGSITWQGTATLPTTTGNYYLTGNVTIPADSPWEIGSTSKRGSGTDTEVDIVLCLNGHTITVNNTTKGTGYILVENGSLTITDCQSGGKITGVDGGSKLAVTVACWNHGCTLNLYGGTITGITASNGGGVYNEGTFNMYGGTITGNKATSTDNGGGGVFIKTNSMTDAAQAVFNMYGGTITGNTANQNGGGVCIQDENSTFKMYGGTISDNKATGNAGGGVFNTGGTFIMTGGTIENNTAKQTEGNDVHIWDNGKMNANGGTIKGNVYNQSGAITTENGKDGTTFNGAVANGDIIGSNTGTISGGNYNGTVTNTSKGEIKGGSYSSTVTNESGSTVTSTDGSVVNNGSFVFENSSTDVTSLGLGGDGNVLTANSEGEGYTVTDNSGATMTDATVAVKDAAALAAAVSATGVTKIVLGDDITLNSTIRVEKKLTIDLNGHKITRGGNVQYGAFFVNSGGDLTLTGTGTVTDMEYTNTGDSGLLYVSSHPVEPAKLTIDPDVTVTTEHKTTYCVVIYGNNGDGYNAKAYLTVKGTLASTYKSGANGDVAATISGNGNPGYGNTYITIEPGATVSNQSTYAIYHPQAGELTINGGTITGVGGIEAKAGSTTITVSGNPTITATGTASHETNNDGSSTTGYALAVVENSNYYGGARMSIASGTITGEIGIVEDNEVPSDKKGSISITGGTFSTNPSAYVASGYYVAANSDGSYTVYQRTYSSGSSSSNITTSTVKNPDGSSTTTTTNKTTGVTTEVTKNTDGSVDTVITNKDGSTTESTKTSGGTTATVETNKNGDTTSVSASVSSTDARNANKSGDSVSLPLTGVTPAASSAEAQTIDIDVPSNVSSVTVEIPVEDVTPGTVVIIVNKDGTETIVPTSTVTENGIEVTLTEDATIKIVDNSKTFKDVPESNVFHDEIAAMSARGIMVGKTDDTFDVYGDVTLNQIVNVAGRVSGAVATEDYEGGIAWGAANGLATGDTPATRGQVILALYVAAGSPDAMDTGKLSAYSDGASVPSELLSAVLWAVENGILKGTDAGTLDLGSNVTRGQAAAFAGRTLKVIG